MSEIKFTDLVSGQECELVIPESGPVTVRHPGCGTGADLVIDLDAFFCPACKSGGRISGAWAADAIRAERRPG